MKIKPDRKITTTDLNLWTSDDMKIGILLLFRRTAGLIRLIAFLSALNLFFLVLIVGAFLYQYQWARPPIDGILSLWKGLQIIGNFSLLAILICLSFVFEKAFSKWIDRSVKKTLKGVSGVQ